MSVLGFRVISWIQEHSAFVPFVLPGASSTPGHGMFVNSWIPSAFTTAPAWESMMAAWTPYLAHERLLRRG